MSRTIEEKIVANARRVIKTCRASMTTNHPTPKQIEAKSAMSDLEWLLSWYEYTKGETDANS